MRRGRRFRSINLYWVLPQLCSKSSSTQPTPGPEGTRETNNNENKSKGQRQLTLMGHSLHGGHYPESFTWTIFARAILLTTCEAGSIIKPILQMTKNKVWRDCCLLYVIQHVEFGSTPRLSDAGPHADLHSPATGVRRGWPLAERLRVSPSENSQDSQMLTFEGTWK